MYDVCRDMCFNFEQLAVRTFRYVQNMIIIKWPLMWPINKSSWTKKMIKYAVQWRVNFMAYDGYVASS